MCTLNRQKISSTEIFFDMCAILYPLKWFFRESFIYLPLNLNGSEFALWTQKLNHNLIEFSWALSNFLVVLDLGVLILGYKTNEKINYIPVYPLFDTPS